LAILLLRKLLAEERTRDLCLSVPAESRLNYILSISAGKNDAKNIAFYVTGETEQPFPGKKTIINNRNLIFIKHSHTCTYII